MQHEGAMQVIGSHAQAFIERYPSLTLDQLGQLPHIA
jgi:hypothetical protein